MSVKFCCNCPGEHVLLLNLHLCLGGQGKSPCGHSVCNVKLPVAGEAHILFLVSDDNRSRLGSRLCLKRIILFDELKQMKMAFTVVVKTLKLRADEPRLKSGYQ